MPLDKAYLHEVTSVKPPHFPNSIFILDRGKHSKTLLSPNQSEKTILYINTTTISTCIRLEIIKKSHHIQFLPPLFKLNVDGNRPSNINTVILQSRTSTMALYCEHCPAFYNNRGPLSNHKFAVHYGGYDCDECDKNYKRRGTLNDHHLSSHGTKLVRDRDYCPTPAHIREEMDRLALAKRAILADNRLIAQHTPAIHHAVSPVIPVAMATTSTARPHSTDNSTLAAQEKVDDTISMDQLVLELLPSSPPVPKLAGQHCCSDSGDDDLPSGPFIDMLSKDNITPVDLNNVSYSDASSNQTNNGEISRINSHVDINDVEVNSIIDLSTFELASKNNIGAVMEDLNTQNIRLGVNFQALVYNMGRRAQQLHQEGIPTNQILEELRPKYLTKN